MRKKIKIISISLLGALIIIQFIRPEKNISESVGPYDISAKYLVPDDVQNILKISCYDCHSNNTRYPWYWQIQPVTWFMNGHIKDAKKGLNFSTFTSYKIRRQYKLFDNIDKEVKSGDMPLTSYTLIHRDAILNDTEKVAIAKWTILLRKEIENNYPPDSLVNNDATQRR